jgi:hypothetical protein
MKFAKDQVVNQVKKPTNSGEVKSGNDYESRLRIFTEPKFEEHLKTEEAWKDFKKFMATALSNERDVRITEFIQYPLSVCGITKGLMSDVYKVFNAGNSYFNIETVKKNGGDKLRKVLEQINLNRWIEEQGKDVLRNQPNTIVVVDKDENGDPYLIPVTNDRLIDVKLKDDFTTLEYVTFIHSTKTNEAGELETRIALYDDENYNVILRKKDGTHTLEKHVPHGLDFCPARMFLKERLNSNGELNRRSPLSLVLSKLQEWQLFDLYKFYTDHYAPFPIVEMVRGKCGNDSCVKGVIYNEETHYADNEAKTITTTTDCPVCKSNNQIGVGAKIMLDPQEDDEPTASGKFRIISNDISNLNYLKEKLQDIEQYVKLKTVGADNLLSKEAVNEKQVQGSFETKTNVLLGIKTNLDELYEWIAKTVASLSIGDKPISVTANFGTEWYLISEDELQERFKTAVAIGLPKEEVDMIYHQLIETKYKGNPNKIARLKIINKLNPCPYTLTKDKIEKRKYNLISQKSLVISENLITFVNKFELEQGSIVEFGENLESDEQLKQILTIINKYADEYIKENDTEPIGGGKKTDE